MLGLQTSGSVHQLQIRLARASGTNRVEDNGSGVGIAAGVGDHRNITALSPDLNLLHSCSPEGVCGRDQSRITAANSKVGKVSKGGGGGVFGGVVWSMGYVICTKKYMIRYLK